MNKLFFIISENRNHGDIAQLGEHSPCKRKVVGSNPTDSIQVIPSVATSLMVKTL